MKESTNNKALRLSLAAPGQNLESYISAVYAVPVLSQDEERSLAERLFYDKDLTAAQQLVMAHLRFVVHIARSYSGYGLPQADLIQEGNVGLMKAVKRFDPNVGVRLVSFAVHWIKAEIHEYVLKNWRIVKVATTKAQRKLFFNLRGAKKRLGLLTAQEAESVAQDLGVKVRDVREMEGRLFAVDQAFDPLPSQDDDRISAPSAYLEDEDNDPAEVYERAASEADETAQLHKALDALDQRSADIVKRRWLAEGKKATLHELAAEYGVSAERVRQIERGAINKVRGLMTAPE